MPKRVTTKSFIREAIEIHGTTYDYSKAEYKGAKAPIIIICKEHGEFTQQPTNHKQGKGCMKCSYRTTHGASIGGKTTRIYNIYQNMKKRCYSPTSDSYGQYGSIGVTVCKEWLKDFATFEAWALLNGYTDELVLDKDRLCEEQGISPKIYSPSTCEWVTIRANVLLTDRERNEKGQYL